jgi:DNA primase
MMSAIMSNPDIVDVITQRVALRRTGHEHVGLCPFHDDRHPSFSVSEHKQVYYCHGCQVGGDVVDFIMRIDDLSFPDACKALGVDLKSKPRPKLTAKRKHAAEVAAIWVREQRAKLNSLIIEDMEERDLADAIDDFQLVEIFERELIMLRGFHDALNYATGAAELLAVRESIEQITADVELLLDPPPPFPPLTSEYLAKLRENPLDFEGGSR